VLLLRASPFLTFVFSFVHYRFLDRPRLFSSRRFFLPEVDTSPLNFPCVDQFGSHPICFSVDNLFSSLSCLFPFSRRKGRFFGPVSFFSLACAVVDLLIVALPFLPDFESPRLRCSRSLLAFVVGKGFVSPPPGCKHVCSSPFVFLDVFMCFPALGTQIQLSSF